MLLGLKKSEVCINAFKNPRLNCKARGVNRGHCSFAGPLLETGYEPLRKHTFSENEDASPRAGSVRGCG